MLDDFFLSGIKEKALNPLRMEVFSTALLTFPHVELKQGDWNFDQLVEGRNRIRPIEKDLLRHKYYTTLIL